MSGTAASTKVWRRVGVHARDALIRSLTAVELRMILADVARARAQALTPVELMKRWREDRLLASQPVDPRETLGILGRLWNTVPPEFSGVTLSPLTSLGSSIHLGGRGQNRVITTMRGTELLADPVHGLALEAAKLRRSGHARVHLATHANVIHTWDQVEEAAHELRFSLASSAPDTGGLATEVELLDLHLGFWREVIGALVPQGRVELAVWDDALAALLAERGSSEGVTLLPGAERAAWRNPYVTAAFRFVAADSAIEFGDGGLVAWTQALTRNRKDRCVVSGIGVHALLRHAGECETR